MTEPIARVDMQNLPNNWHVKVGHLRALADDRETFALGFDTDRGPLTVTFPVTAIPYLLDQLETTLQETVQHTPGEPMPGEIVPVKAEAIDRHRVRHAHAPDGSPIIILGFHTTERGLTRHFALTLEDARSIAGQIGRHADELEAGTGTPQ